MYTDQIWCNYHHFCPNATIFPFLLLKCPIYRATFPTIFFITPFYLKYFSMLDALCIIKIFYLKLENFVNEWEIKVQMLFLGKPLCFVSSRNTLHLSKSTMFHSKCLLMLVMTNVFLIILIKEVFNWYWFDVPDIHWLS